MQPKKPQLVFFVYNEAVSHCAQTSAKVIIRFSSRIPINISCH
jgi:hypothetical protein